MALNKGFARNATTDAIDARLMDAELFYRNADGSVRTGILQTAAAGGNIATGTGTMAVAIASADFVLSRSVNDGAYRLSNLGVVNVTLAGAPASNSRYDVIYVKQNDSTAGDSTNDAVFDKVTGTAAASPSIPAVPSGALAIATILVPAGVTSTTATGVFITNVAQFTTIVGGLLRYRSLAAAQADTAVVADTRARIIGTVLTYRYDGTAWRIWEQPPTVTNLTGVSVGSLNFGASTPTFVVSVRAGIVRIDFRARFGAGTLSWGDFRYTLPYPVYDVFGITVWGGAGQAVVNDVSDQVYGCWNVLLGDGSWRMARTAADTARLGSWAQSAPFTPATGDTAQGWLEYPAA